MRLEKTLGLASVMALMLSGAAYASVQTTTAGPMASQAPKVEAAPAPAGEKVAVVDPAAVAQTPVSEVQVPGKKTRKPQPKYIYVPDKTAIIRDPFEALQHPAIRFSEPGFPTTGGGFAPSRR